MSKLEYAIDGSRIRSLDDFYDEIERVLLDDEGRRNWGRNLDALDEVLSGTMGAPEEDYVLLWEQSQFSRLQMDHDELVRVLTAMLNTCHHTTRPTIENRIDAARQHTGPTLFDWLVEIVGENSSVTLRLE